MGDNPKNDVKANTMNQSRSWPRTATPHKLKETTELEETTELGGTTKLEGTYSHRPSP